MTSREQFAATTTRDEILDLLSPEPCHESCRENEDAGTLGWVADEVSAWHDREIAHAVALERERIAGWLDSYSDGTDDDEYHQLAEFVRQGAHNPQTPTSGPGAGSGATDTPNVTDATPGTDSGPRTPETDTCRREPEREDG